MTPDAADVAVRRAVPDEADAGARCQLACWAEAYGELADPELLAVQLADVEGRVASWRAQLAGGHAPWVAAAGDQLVGFASAGPPPPSEPDPPLMLYALYVRRSWWGSDLGHRLVSAALGDAAASLWVFRDNHRARRFYTRHGFRADGTEREQAHFGGVEIRMVRPG